MQDVINTRIYKDQSELVWRIMYFEEQNMGLAYVITTDKDVICGVRMLPLMSIRKLTRLSI